jgi:hypothetical protein
MPQIVGEAAARHSAGADFAIPRALWIEAATQQEDARQQSRHEILFAEWFAQTELAVFITAADLAIIVKSIEPGARHYTETLRKIGFTLATKRVDGKPAKVWHRGDLANASRLIPRLREGTLVPSLHYPTLPVGMPAALPAVPMPPVVA